MALTEEEEREQSPAPWARLAIAGTMLVCLLMAFWIWLPNVAAFGLRYDRTRPASRNVLKWLGPRAIRQIFEQQRHFGPLEWDSLVKAICRQSEADEYSRGLLVRSLSNPDARGLSDMTLLHYAAWEKCVQVSVALIDAGADVNAKTSHGGTPLHWAAELGHSDIAALLLSRGANLEAKDRWGGTALHCAAENGHSDVTDLLMARGADVNAKMNNGWTPLHGAVGNGRSDVADLLITRGADTNSRDKKGETALDFALEGDHQDVTDILRKQGARTGAQLDAAVPSNKGANHAREDR